MKLYVSILALFLSQAHAIDMSQVQVAVGAIPECTANGQALPINNDQVIAWETSTPNGYRARGHVQGTVTKIYPDATGHHHTQVQIHSANPRTIEMVYNEQFGPTPPFQVGAQVEGCGDYVTSNAYTGGFRPSPDGAVLHWLHRSDTRNHDGGFLVINGTVTGI